MSFIKSFFISISASIYLFFINAGNINAQGSGGYFPLTSATDAQQLGLAEPSNLQGVVTAFFNNGLIIIGFLAVLMITFGGIQYMGGESVFSKDEGKKKIGAAIAGVILALGSWLILNTINSQITAGNVSLLETQLEDGGTVAVENETGTERYDTPESVGQTPPNNGESTPFNGTEAEILQRIGGNVRTNGPNTSLTGFQNSTVDGLRQLQTESGHGFIITGGTEHGHSGGQYSHGNGYKADIGMGASGPANSGVDTYIRNTYFNGQTPVPNETNNRTLQNGQNVNFRWEASPPHWDIVFYPTS